jgi:hypothetical protein
VRLHVTGAPDGTIVELQGAKTRLPSDGNLTLLSAPGDAIVTIQPPSGEPVTRTSTVVAGAEVTLDVALQSPVQSTPIAVPPRDRPQPSDGGERRPWALPVAIAAGGVGLIGTAMFIGFGASSQATFDELKLACGASCDARRDEVEAGEREQTFANVSLVLGVTGLAASAAFTILWLTDEGAPPAPGSSASRRVKLVVGPGHARVQGTF